jgi:hypothetical protein
MKSIIDLTGQRFSRLAVVGPAKQKKYGKTTWNCLCDCGNTVNIPGSQLRNGNNRSCGCLLRETITTHGHSIDSIRSPEYTAWTNMKDRCLNANRGDYHRYGGRGIKVCDRWLSSFESFYEDMGKRPTPKHSLERENNEKDYEPGNVKWATPKEQQNNRSSNAVITFMGQQKTIKQWAETMGINYHTLWHRIRIQGWSIEKALLTPAPKHRNYPSQ